MKPIILVTWPRHLDFPLFRHNLARFGKHFASCWIGLSNHHQASDYTNFLMAQLPEAHFVDVLHTGQDWRSDAVNEVLDQIKTNEPIMFTEQDFLIRDDSFFEKVLGEERDFTLFTEGQRIHPAFAVVQRALIERTTRDFGAYPGLYGDHFAKFFGELPKGVNINTLGVESKEDYCHLNGLSQNYMNVQYDDPIYMKNSFTYYNFSCLGLPLQIHPEFIQIMQMVENKLGHHPDHPFLDKFFDYK